MNKKALLKIYRGIEIIYKEYNPRFTNSQHVGAIRAFAYMLDIDANDYIDQYNNINYSGILSKVDDLIIGI